MRQIFPGSEVLDGGTRRAPGTALCINSNHSVMRDDTCHARLRVALATSETCTLGAYDSSLAISLMSCDILRSRHLRLLPRRSLRAASLPAAAARNASLEAASASACAFAAASAFFLLTCSRAAAIN